MLNLAESLTLLHGLMRWLALASGGWMLALALAMLWRRQGLGLLELRSLTVFTGALHAQVGLGVIIALLMNGAGAPPFEGRTATLMGHALGGVLMAVCATLATVLGRRARTALSQAAWVAVFSGLAWLLIGKWLYSIPLVLAALVIVVLLKRATSGAGASPEDGLRDGQS
jgi:hypothetical protein